MNDVSQRQKLTGGVTKVDSNATVPNGISNDTANNNDITSPMSAFIATTSFPDITTIDIITAVQPTNLSFASRLAAEIISDSVPKIISTTIRIPENPDTNKQPTIVPIMDSSEINTSNNTMIDTLASANISNTLMSFNVTMTEIVTHETSTNDVTSDILLSIESTSDNIRPIESVIKTMELTSPSTMITDLSTPTYLNLQKSTNISDIITSSPITESITVTQISPEATTISVINDISENIETNTVQQYNETIPTTEINDIVKNIEINMIQQFNTTIPPQKMKTMSITESITMKNSNNITEIQVTQTPVTTSTFHTRFINIAQNISSHLQDSFSTARTSIQNPIITTIFPKYNVILNSSWKEEINTRNSEETTTIWKPRSENVEITTNQDVNIKSAQTTINKPVQKMNIQNIVNVAAEFSIAHNRSNEQEINAWNMSSSNMTHNARDSSIDIEIANNSQFADFITNNNSRLSNDTLLTKLMTIAKTLFSEEIKETRQSLSNQIYDVETTTVSDINNWTQTDSMIENDSKNQLMLSNDTSEVTNASAELSTVLKNISERIDVTTFGNGIEEHSNRPPTVGSEISLMEFNARPTNNKNLIDVGDIIITPLFQTKKYQT